jgi:hypothetical protein
LLIFCYFAYSAAEFATSKHFSTERLGIISIAELFDADVRSMGKKLLLQLHTRYATECIDDGELY